MVKITQKNLVEKLSGAFASNSVKELKSVLDLGSEKQQKNVYFSDVWKNIVSQNSIQLTPYKAFSFARVVSNQFGSTKPFQDFVENCAPLHVYLQEVKLEGKPSVLAHIHKWVLDSFIHAEYETHNLFVFLNQKLDPAVAKLNPEDFLWENDIWWPSVNPVSMQKLADIQPLFVDELQKIIIKKLNKTQQDLNAITTPSNDILKNDVIEKVVAQSLGNSRPYLYILMRPHLQNIVFNSNKEKSPACDLAICTLQGEMYVGLVALQTWNQYGLLKNTQLIEIHNIVSNLDAMHQAKIEHFSMEDFSDVEVTGLLRICQKAYIAAQLAPLSSFAKTRKI